MTIGGKTADKTTVKRSVDKAKKACRRPYTKRQSSVTDADTSAAKERAEAFEKDSAIAQRRHKDEEAIERVRLLYRGLRKFSQRAAREAEKSLLVTAAWPVKARPSLQTVCPARLYNRMEPLQAKQDARVKPARVASDGYRNLVCKMPPAGSLGSKAENTYKFGEAEELARYILRPEGAELGEQAFHTNILGDDRAVTGDGTVSLDQCAEVVAFWRALEAYEEIAKPDSNQIYQHIIIALPCELSPKGRSQAMKALGNWFDKRGCPYVIGLHKPDKDGDQRNFHAHVIVSYRHFRREGEYAWSFGEGKVTELNSSLGRRYLRRPIAKVINDALASERINIRYAAKSQDERGVERSDEQPMGAKKTAQARKRQAADERIVARLRTFADGLVDQVRSLRGSIEAMLEASGPSGLERVRLEYPDPHKIAGLEFKDFEDYSKEDRTRDEHYFPQVLLRMTLRDDETVDRSVRFEDGKARFDAEKLWEGCQSVAGFAEKTDIFAPLLEAATAREQARQLQLDKARKAKEAKITKEREELRRREQREAAALERAVADREGDWTLLEEQIADDHRQAAIDFLREPRKLFDEEGNLLPELRPVFEGLADDEKVRAAVKTCQDRWEASQRNHAETQPVEALGAEPKAKTSSELAASGGPAQLSAPGATKATNAPGQDVEEPACTSPAVTEAHKIDPGTTDAAEDDIDPSVQAAWMKGKGMGR